MSHDLQVNLPAGLRDTPMFKSKNAAVVQDLVETQKERNPGIHSILQAPIEHKFNTPGTELPVLEKDSLIPKFVDPSEVPLTSKFSYALGLEQVVQSQTNDRNVQDIISVNHQLRDGNFVGAQQTLGRDLTAQEITSRQITPSTLTGMFTYTKSDEQNFARSEALHAQDQIYQTELYKLEDRLLAGDDISAGVVRQIGLHFKNRTSDTVDPAVWQLYQEVYPKAIRYLNKGELNRKHEHNLSQPNPFNLPHNEEEKKEEEKPSFNHPLQPQNKIKGDGIGKIPKGWIRFGKYEFDRAKLKHHNILSLRYEKTKRKINSYPNLKVGNGFRDHVFHLSTGEGEPQKLNPDEERMVHRLIQHSEANIHPLGMTTVDSPANPMNSLYTMLAEVNAGNDSIKLRLKIEKMLTAMTKSGHISSELAQKIRSEYF